MSVVIRLNTNRRTLLSYRRLGRRGSQGLQLSIHRSFCDAPDNVLACVAAWLNARETTETRARLRYWMNMLSSPDGSASLEDGEQEEENVLGVFAPSATNGGLHRESEQLDLFARVDAVAPPRPGRGSLPPPPEPLQPGGRHHDLRAMADRLNYQYFEGRCPVHITWGRAPVDRLPPGEPGSISPRRRRRRGRGGVTILFGTYSAREHLVRIHPRLDARDVPAYFVEYIIYHEMLHKFAPPKLLPTGRREVHTREFRHLERRFVDYRKARLFERRFLREML